MKIKKNSLKVTLASIFLMLGQLASAETTIKDSFDSELVRMNLIGMSVNSAEGIIEFTIEGVIDREMLAITVDGLGEITQYCDSSRDAEKWDFICTVYYSNKQGISIEEPGDVASDEAWVKSEISMAILENIDKDSYRIKVKYPVLNPVDERFVLELKQGFLETVPNVIVREGAILISSEINFTDLEQNNMKNDKFAVDATSVAQAFASIRMEQLNNKYPSDP